MPIWIEKPLDEGTYRLLSDGYKIIIDKENYFQDITHYIKENKC